MDNINETDIQVYTDTATSPYVSNPLDSNPVSFKAGLDRRKDNRRTLMEWIRSALVEGRDYGSIMIGGKQSKPSLLKPGAEKIAGMLGLIPRFPNLEQYEQSVLSGKQIDAIILKCELRNQNGEVIGEGVGARFVEQQDQGDLNKALKMASKSAMIDATLRCAGISEVFTQDIEEMPIIDIAAQQAEARQQYENVELASEKQIQTIRRLIDNPKVYPEEKRELHERLEDRVTKDKAREVLDYYYGPSEYINGAWVKTQPGELGCR